MHRGPSRQHPTLVRGSPPVGQPSRAEIATAFENIRDGKNPWYNQTTSHMSGIALLCDGPAGRKSQPRLRTYPVARACGTITKYIESGCLDRGEGWPLTRQLVAAHEYTRTGCLDRGEGWPPTRQLVAVHEDTGTGCLNRGEGWPPTRQLVAVHTDAHCFFSVGLHRWEREGEIPRVCQDSARIKCEQGPTPRRLPGDYHGPPLLFVA